MDLTSAAFLWLLRLTLLGLVVAVVLWWRLLARPGVWAVLSRLVALVLVGSLSALNVAAAVNAEYGWYVSFADLKTMFDPAAVPATMTGNHVVASTAVAAAVGPDPATNVSAKDRHFITGMKLTATDYGGYQDFTVPGPLSGYTGTVTVWVPPSYTQDPNATNYPVIEGYHGYLPSPYGFFTVAHLDQVIQQQVQAKVMRDPILVIPHWAPNRVDTECVNAPAGGLQMETWLTQDIPRWVYTHFRVAAARTSWSTWGMSAGGWCAMLSTLLHPTTYGTAVSLGGYTQPDFDPSYVPFPKGSALWKRYDLNAKVGTGSPPSVGIWALTSTADHISYKSASWFIEHAKAPTAVDGVILNGGGHRTDTWLPYLGDTLSWLARSSAGFR